MLSQLHPAPYIARASFAGVLFLLVATQQPGSSGTQHELEELEKRVADMQRQIDRHHAHLLINTNAALAADTITAKLSTFHTAEARQTILPDLLELKKWGEAMIAIRQLEKELLSPERRVALQQVLDGLAVEATSDKPTDK